MNYAQNVRDAIDKLDETPFGQVGKLFDTMADDAQRAVNDRKHLIEALAGLVLVCGRTGNSLEDFEDQAATFQAETGFMRPGKDMPMDSSGEDNSEVRRAKYSAWVQSKIENGRAALAGLQPEMGSFEWYQGPGRRDPSPGNTAEPSAEHSSHDRLPATGESK